MIFTTDKESLLNKIKTVEKITVQRGPQFVLANILFETEKNNLKLTATDLDISIITNTTAAVKEEGKITLPAKKIFEIVSKLPDKPIDFSLNKDTNVVTIKCGNSKFEVKGITADEFPKVIENEEELSEKEGIVIDTEPFIKSIKYTVYSAANYESRNIISGVFCKINDRTIEMAATDGNRLTRISEEIKNKTDKESKIVIPSKTMNEFLRVSSIINEDNLTLIVSNKKVIFKTKEYVIISRLLEGEYPLYQQLIPKTTANKLKVKKDSLSNAIDRVSCMINERTNVIKLILNDGKIMLKAETPDSGMSEEVIEADYKGEEFVIAFNYKFISDFMKIIDSENAIIEFNSNQSAAVFKPDSKDDYICLIMPLKI